LVLVSKKRHLVIQVDLMLPAFTILLCTVAVLCPTLSNRLWQLIVEGLALCVFLAASLSLQRMVRRVDDELEIWTVLGRRRVKAKRVFLGVTVGGGARGGPSINIKIFLGKSMHPAEPSILVASDPTQPLAVARRIAEALDMPEPQVDPSLFQ
jgi:hypothetical protein